ncbi:hypothetical protein [uncultured Sphingomonas sp.]|uniref:hypothetical protein n=1 Tax=uncultured Sphingomonas sp. TaxID=158754 RepID=UPI0035CA6682
MAAGSPASSIARFHIRLISERGRGAALTAETPGAIPVGSNIAIMVEPTVLW